MEEIISKEINLTVSESKSGSYQVAKSNKLIESQYELSANQQKLLSACISQVNPKKNYCEVEGEKVAFAFDFSREDVMRLIKVESKHLSPFLEEAALKFQGLHAHHAQGTGSDRKFVVVNLIEKCEYDGERFYVLFTASASKELYDLKKVGYTKYLLENILELTSQYAIRFYELIQRLMNPRLYTQTCSFMLADLYFFLGIIDFKGDPLVRSAAKTFSNFFNDILLVILNQINERTDLHIELIEKKRVGRKIGKLVFLVKREKPVIDMNNNGDLETRLVAAGVDSRIATGWIETISEAVLESNLKLMKDQMSFGKRVNNTGAYLNFLISNDIANLPDVANPHSFLYSKDRAAQDFVKLVILPAWRGLSEEWQRDLIENGIQASNLGPEYARWKTEYVVNSIDAKSVKEIAAILNQM